MSVTIKDVAKIAGVSPSTVSRVISDDPSISDKTKEKVREIMMQMKYYPNMNARRLVSQKSNIIGLVLPNNTDNFYQNPFFPTVLRGINDVSTSADYHLLLNTGNTEEERLEHVKQLIFGKQVDGLVLLYSKRDDPIVKFLRENKFPFVVIGTPEETDIHFVDNNNELIGRQAANYLLNLGARKLAFVGGDTDQDFIQLRFQGYKKALETYGIPVQSSLVFNDFEFLSSSGYDLAFKLREINHLDGLIIADELVARGVKEGWHQLGKKEIPILTFKSYAAKEMNRTTDIFININGQRLGQEALKMLLTIIQDDNKIDQFLKEIVDAELVT